MAVRGLSIINHKAAASLPNRNGVKVRLSSGESRFRTEGSQALVYDVPKKLYERAQSSECYFFGVCAFGFPLP